MEFQLVKADWLITTFQIRQPKGLIKSIPAIKKQHQLVMVMSRQFRVHLNKLKELLRIRYSLILDRQYSMCNSRQSKVRTRRSILAHQATYHHQLKN